MDLPNKRPDDMARITTIELANKFIDEQVELVREQVKDKKVLLALDVTEPVLNEAEQIGAELIISHHPVIFGALKEIHPKNIAFLAAQKGIAIISAHTCLDIADGGVNDCLAAALELKNIVKVDDGEGLMRIGELSKELTCEEFVKYVAEKINVGGIKYTPNEKMIKNLLK